MSVYDALDAAVATFDPDEVKKLFIFITGSDRVPLQSKIKASLAPTTGIPSSHSCFQQLDVGYFRYVQGSAVIDDLQEKVKSDLSLSLQQYNIFTGDVVV